MRECGLSHAPRVILFGAIPAIIPDIPEIPIVPPDPIVKNRTVGTVSVISPVTVLDLVDYTSFSESDHRRILNLPYQLPWVSPFLFR
ncbi:hypothetical protein Tco_0246846 [Tanacetum coccineum]|uniref:Uncharacterized protein n=1 Tax=Tanacetum coccineum TaxID=301880 RepID=A0ABQ5H9E7_9ASTR